MPLHTASPAWVSLPNAADSLPWYRNRGACKLWFFVSILYVADYLSGFDGNTMGGILALPYWKADVGHPSASKLGLLNAMTYITGILIGPANYYVSDKWGRRWPMRFYAVMMLLGTVFGSIAGVGSLKGDKAFGLFILSKGLIGAGLTAGQMTSMTILQEIAHPRNRTQVTGFYDATWILGSVSAAWVVFGCSHIQNSWSWRIPYLIQLIPALFILIAIGIVPETPRFLMAQGREEEALAFLVEYHGNGDVNDQMVQFEWKEMKGTLLIENAQKSQRWRDILRVPANRHRLGLAALMTFLPQLDGSQIITTYYSAVFKLVGITQPSVQTGIAAGLSMFKFCCQCLGVFLLPRVNRRTLVLSTWPLLILAMVAIIVSNALFVNSGKKDTHAGISAVFWVWIFGGLHIFNTPLFYSYPAEILNYGLRAKGMSVWNFANQGCGLYSAYTNSVGLASIGWKYYLTYLPILFLQWALAYLYMVETRGLSLEEVAMVFEGPSAGVAKVDAELGYHLGTGGGEKLASSDEDASDKEVVASGVVPAA